jgi:hypothetical protein
MDRPQLLKKLGLTQHELDELLVKTRHFIRSLNKAQRKVVEASLPNITTAVDCFDDDVSEQDLLELFSQGDDSQGVICFCIPEDNGF